MKSTIKKNNKQCEICGVEATSLCLKCLMYLCDKCYKFIHEKEINHMHKKEEIDYFVPFDTKCQEHPKNIINLFCLDEKGKIIYLYNFLFNNKI